MVASVQDSDKRGWSIYSATLHRAGHKMHYYMTRKPNSLSICGHHNLTERNMKSLFCDPASFRPEKRCILCTRALENFESMERLINREDN